MWSRALVLSSIFAIASCATVEQTPAQRRASNLELGIAFAGAGAASIAVGAGLFGYALGHEPANEDTPRLALFLPGVAIFGIGIPFFVTGAIFAISAAVSRR